MDNYSNDEKLCMMIDVGTTQTAVAFVHLQPGGAPKVRTMSRWPGDKTSSKIPTLIYYEKHSRPVAFGAEAMHEEVQVQAAQEGWFKCVHFKLHLHSSSMQAPPSYQVDPIEADGSSASARAAVATSTLGRARGLFSGFRTNSSGQARQTPKEFELAPLPEGVKIEKVYEDWLGYVWKSAKEWWCETNVDGEMIWEKLKKDIIVCLAHPNGWSLVEQNFLRAAMAKAVITKSPELTNWKSSENVCFVTEGEASVHFGLNYTSASNKESWLNVGTQFAVVDAGGSTVDTTVYEVVEVSPKLKLREVKPSGCAQCGAIFPTRDARTIIKEKLSNSKYNSPEYLEDIVAQFDQKTKINFKDESDPVHYIKFGFDRDNDKEFGISRGRLSLTGAEVAKAFKPSMDLLLESVSEQLEGTHCKVILISGGFGESPHVQRRLRERFETPSTKIITSDEPTQKAVAVGSGLYYIQDSIVARASRFTFGTYVRLPANQWPSNLLNVGKGNEHHTYTCVNGVRYQNGVFSTLLKRGVVLGTEQVISKNFTLNKKSDFVHKAAIWLCENEKVETIEEQMFMIDSKGVIKSEYKHVCDVRADLSHLQTDANRRHVVGGKDSEYYWFLKYKIDLLFGGTSLKARLRWEENGVERLGPVSIIPSIYY